MDSGSAGFCQQVRVVGRLVGLRGIVLDRIDAACEFFDGSTHFFDAGALGLGAGGQGLGAFGDNPAAFIELRGAFGDLSDDLGKVLQHSVDSGSEFVDRFVALDGETLRQITFRGCSNHFQHAVDFATDFFGFSSFLFRLEPFLFGQFLSSSILFFLALSFHLSLLGFLTT